MLERDEYPPGVPCWVDVDQPDAEAATDFYGGLFGWTFEDRMPAGRPGHYFVAHLDGHDVAAIASRAGESSSPPTWNTYIAVARADDATARVRDAGGTVEIGPIDVGDAGRTAACADPDGAHFRLWEGRARKGAAVVNVPGSWNFSDLQTHAAEKAQAFYGAVFGWEFVTFEAAGRVTLVRLPGYGDFLARRDPEIRARQAADGAPADFADAVAWIAAPAPDARGADAEPHWSVTFAVDDTDAAATRAEELGGRIASGPTDTPPVRTAVIVDPHGARFTVSRYDPHSR